MAIGIVSWCAVDERADWYKLFEGHLPSIKIVNTNPFDLTLPLLRIYPIQVHKNTH